MNNMKQKNKTVEVQGVTVLLVFAPKSNEAIPTLVRDILDAAYARQQTA